MKHLVIIDGHHLMYRAYWAIPRHLSTRAGEQVNTVFGVASMLINILKAEQPDSLLFCFDAGEQTFRHKEYAEYKEGRAETPDDFFVQIPRVMQFLDACDIKYVSDGGFEADDFACAYAKAASDAGSRVTIVTGDRDLLQLVSPTIRVAIPHKGYQQPEYIGPDELTVKYGVTPEQFPSYKGLVGDASDNLPGVMGIGPKAAQALIAEFGTIENLYNHLDAVKPAWKAKLEAGREQAFFCLKMATLRCDMPLPLGLADLRLHVPLDAVLAFFQDVNFTLLTKRLQVFALTEYGKNHFHCASARAPQAATSAVTQLSLL